jgi:N6-adenosine-specific RNA methylase IME4
MNAPASPVPAVTHSALAALGDARAAIERVTTVDDAKGIRDRAEALRVYAAQAGESLAVQNACAEVKLRAERRCGELLASTVEHGGDRRSESRSRDATLNDLGLNRSQSSRWQALAGIPELDWERHLRATVDAGRELTTASALKLAKQTRPVPQPAARKPLPEGAFSAIVADPPWQYDNRATRGAAEDHYATMTLEDVKALDVPAAPAAHLYLWTTNGFLREAFEVVEAWGFTYKTCITWTKPQIGLGNYFRNRTEHILFATRGRLATQDNTRGTWFQAPRGKHSAKPDCFYDLVEKSSPGPYLEMFSRRRRLGWEGWGHEA